MINHSILSLVNFLLFFLAPSKLHLSDKQHSCQNYSTQWLSAGDLLSNILPRGNAKAPEWKVRMTDVNVSNNVVFISGCHSGYIRHISRRQGNREKGGKTRKAHQASRLLNSAKSTAGHSL